MLKCANTRGEAFEFALASGGEFVGCRVGVVAGATAGIDEARIDNGADEGDAFVDGLFVLFFGMKGEAEFGFEIFCNDVDVAE